jgi:hypothetical protein
MRPKIALFLAYSSICARAQMQQGLGANGQQQALQPLDSVLMQAFDKSHDGKVTLTEVLESLDGFAAMGAMGGRIQPASPTFILDQFCRPLPGGVFS